ncbi:F-box/LRR-repeat protein-like [Iris pallida]|uniref:F-box/LRR-repeat protein-like n=1 Tax=Iris pallida TaxID=29817 RepID=A0AAX6HBF0_IRIPA|nr:F-box/LRR-repeat protein-like [Iris pallida]
MENCRKWEEMERDCLVCIFQRLSLEDLTLGVPWCASRGSGPRSTRSAGASSTSSGWTSCRGGGSPRGLRRTTPLALLLLGLPQVRGAEEPWAGGRAPVPPLPPVSMDDLVYASNECPRLKILILRSLRREDQVRLPKLVGTWKELEHLEMASNPSSFPDLPRRSATAAATSAGSRWQACGPRTRWPS